MDKVKKVLFTATVDSHILHFHIPYLKMFKDVDLEKIFITRFSFIDNFKTKSLF